MVTEVVSTHKYVVINDVHSVHAHACHGIYFLPLSSSHLPSFPLASPLPPFPPLQLIFHAEQEKFTIDDGFQQPITLSSPNRELLGATFYKFVLKNIGTGLHGTSIYASNSTYAMLSQLRFVPG